MGVKWVGRQGEEEEPGGAQIQQLVINPSLACRGHQVTPFPFRPGHKNLFLTFTNSHVSTRNTVSFKSVSKLWPVRNL